MSEVGLGLIEVCCVGLAVMCLPIRLSPGVASVLWLRAVLRGAPGEATSVRPQVNNRSWGDSDRGGHSQILITVQTGGDETDYTSKIETYKYL
ncbi:hypothetical protein E2C01_032977 [Portunus trituberculatus]|uniref:Uncharacterized protein n=1 Tax=Portunus trituberculatus TaxID=210409 RepID=A0A5B7EXC7_PORTR|nr:hypothetical protein [Portunus trituberculatus]